ncbi:YdcF family protein [Streptomyces sp. NPDC047014]|uniref:YdcF family protein n=1 Tax=Streptomyces sp. NPDC047014 TaxID=3155736 RepID=UPI0033D535D1
MLFLAFCVNVRRDRRRFSNAVLLGLTFLTAFSALFLQVSKLPGWATVTVVVLTFASPAFGVLALGVLLVRNGLTMIRKEGLRPATMLSLLAGIAVFALIGLLVLVVVSESLVLGGIAGTLTVVAGYISFVFFCFLGYAFLYGRIKVRGDVGHVVMLGSGLVGGDRVPPLLASRLRKGQQIYERQLARGSRPPLLLVSGGKGTDEKVSEARAMADWLIAEGVPAEHVVLEEQSTTTEENLRFSRAIMEEHYAAYRCVIVTNNFHAFRAAMLARKTGVNGQVVGSPTAKYYWPSATIREFVAVFWEHRAVNLSICGLLTVFGTLGTLAAVLV